ncbi:MAG: hypothetical protein AB7V32_10540 [Candidatus Berkiella sp.]
MTSSFINDNQRYLIIKGALSKEICDLLAEYAIFKESVKPNAKKGILINVHREYGDPLMETMLNKLTPLIEKETGLSLWPTLSFYYVYKNGHQLQKHKDRSSCQIVAGLCIGADSEFKKDNGQWPLILNINGEALPISLDYGDILIFKGSETEHWRDAFTGKWFVSAIFGYVDKNGIYAFQKFDQRKSLGRPHVGMFNWSFGYIKNDIKKRLHSFFSKK